MEKPDRSPQCQEAMPYYYDSLCGQQEQIPEAISAHMVDCEVCQNEIQWLKQTDEKSEEFSLHKLQAISHAAQMQLHCALIDQPVRCSTIKSFLPILAIPEMVVRISTPVTAHIKACDECAHDLETFKELGMSAEQLMGIGGIFAQKQAEDSGDDQGVDAIFPQSVLASLTAVSEILNRPDSGVVTCFRAQGAAAQSDESFTVEVTHEDSVSIDPPADNTSTLKAPITPAPARSKWFLKPLAAAAAVIVIAVLLFQSPSVKATDIGQIYEALKSVQNINMAQYEVDNPDPIQQIWISHSLNVKLLDTSGSFTLYDLKNKVKKNRTNLDSQIQEINLDRSLIESVSKTMGIPWGLLPFNRTADLPDGAVWKKVHPEEIDSGLERTEIYDLFWSEKTLAGNNVYYQWRCHINAVTKHPFKVEWWRKTQQDQDYELTTFTEITYPSQDQVTKVIDQIGF